MLLFSINRSRGYENPSLDIIVTERCSTGGCPLEEACEHCYLIQSAIFVAISYIVSVYCEDYAGYFTVSFLAFHLCLHILYIWKMYRPRSSGDPTSPFLLSPTSMKSSLWCFSSASFKYYECPNELLQLVFLLSYV
jgi:hypothetical protein